MELYLSIQVHSVFKCYFSFTNFFLEDVDYSMQKSEDSLWEQFLFSYHVGPKDQVVSLDSKCL